MKMSTTMDRLETQCYTPSGTDADEEQHITQMKSVKIEGHVMDTEKINITLNMMNTGSNHVNKGGNHANGCCNYITGGGNHTNGADSHVNGRCLNHTNGGVNHERCNHANGGFNHSNRDCNHVNGGSTCNHVNGDIFSEKKANVIGKDVEAPLVKHKINGKENTCKQQKICEKSQEIIGKLKEFYEDNTQLIWSILRKVFLLLYVAYFIYACWYDFEEAKILVILTGIAFVFYSYTVVRNKFGDAIYDGYCLPVCGKVEKKWNYIKWPLYITIVIFILIALFFLTKENPNQLISAAGLVVFVVFMWLGSKSPRQVKWRPVLWGVALQFIMGLFILRTKVGLNIFSYLGDVVNSFINFTDKGAIFVFGDMYTNHYFAFKVLPIVIYFSSVVSVLYYLGVMQFVIVKLAWLMQYTMHTSAGESLNAAGNIFIGQTEAPLLVRPYLHKMTESELHAIMTGGFATIAGGVFGAYISFGISASHLLTASVMSAPAALAIAKLFYPETKESQTVTAEHLKLPKGQERNIVQAASNGASTAIPLVLNIAANLIAFLALLAMLNGLLGYFGGLVGFPDLCFELICSYAFMPIAFMMGTEWEDCREVAELIGTKTFVNEFVAYIRLSEMIENEEISKRSEVIATYACCGFANISCIGIQLGGLSSIAPDRKNDLAKVVVRALIAGSVACFMTACIAGILYVPFEVTENATMNATMAADTVLNATADAIVSVSGAFL